MHTLDDTKRLKRLDKQNALGSISQLGDQLKQVFSDFKQLKLPASFRGINQVVHSGMGGSALGADMLAAVYFDKLTKPFQVVRGYQLPASLDSKTLLVVCSYSGTTEEALASLKQASQTKAKVFAITSGGQLAQLVKQRKIAGYVFDPLANPSRQPRLGIGYTLAAELALLSRLGLLKFSRTDVKKNSQLLNSLQAKFGFAVPASSNLAKQLAQQVCGKALVIVAAEHLAGNAHVLANQTNESGKTLASYHLLPELNHHLLDGLRFPSTNRSELAFVFLESSLYHSRNQLRLKTTKEIVAKNKITSLSYQPSSVSKLSQAFETLSFSSFLTFYLALANNVNPNLIPWVDYLKARLKK